MDILILIMIALMVYMLGIAAGWRAREHRAKEIIEKVLELQERDEEDRIHITLEKHNGIVFVYNKKDSSFMAQGKTKEELEAILSSRFPGKKFAVSEEELQSAGLQS